MVTWKWTMIELWLYLAIGATSLLNVAGQCPSGCNCNSETLQVVCNFATRTTFPDLPADTQTIEIVGQTPNNGIIQSLTKADLQKYENLTEVTLTMLGISSLASDTFTQLSKLKRIDLSKNDIETLPGGVFDSLPDMTYFDLRHNRLTTITSNELKFPLLTVLSLAGNSINLNDSTVFKHLKTMTLLDVSDNYIGDPVPSYQVPLDLEVISMKNCSIRQLSPSLRNLVRNAERLQLQNNLIEEIPIDFTSELHNLREFHLDNNRITMIRNRTFENVIPFMTLNNNRISKIEPEAFVSLQAETLILKITLILKNNLISELPPRVFEPLGADLQTLDLSENPLQELTDETFSGLTALATLNLNSAQIERISDNAFVNTRGNVLDLRRNNLTTLSNYTLDSLAGFNAVNLTENRWNCTQPLIYLRRWLIKNQQGSDCVNDAAENNCLKCASPEKFVGRLVVDLTEEELITALDPETTTPEPTTTTPEPTTTEPTTTEPTTTTEAMSTTEHAETLEPATPELDNVTTNAQSTASPALGGFTPNILLYVCIAIGGTLFLILLVLCCLCMKTCYHCREVTYPLARKELENGYNPETGEKQDDQVQLEHVFTIEGHSNPGFKMAEDDDGADFGTFTTSLSTFRPGREPCRDSGIVGDSPGSDQSINRPDNMWEGRNYGYENRTYNNLDEYT